MSRFLVCVYTHPLDIKKTDGERLALLQDMHFSFGHHHLTQKENNESASGLSPLLRALLV